jgi:hypothetical protein
MALKCEFSWVKCEKAWRTANFAGWKSASKKLRLMKLLPNFYVFTYEGKAKLDAAEKDNDDDCPKTTASSRRPPESYAGADGGTSSAPPFGRALASGSAATRLF